MKKLLPALVTSLVLGCSLSVSAQDTSLSFFITSVGSGNGANLGGLAGADAHCAALAEAAGSSGKTWRAYLSTQASSGSAATHARERIGSGPWYNANGVQVAASVAELHSANHKLSKENSVDENGNVISGRSDTPNRHDILTGSTEDGRAFDGDNNLTCNNWTASGEGSAQVGHHDMVGGGDNGSSWNSAHRSRGCSQENLQSTGGDGLFYCFAF